MGAAPGVLVTRPRELADGLCRAIRALGWRAISLPMMEIVPLACEPMDAGDFDLLIFISRNAVIHGLPLLEGLNDGVRIAAVGKGTAAELQQRQVRVDLLPESRWDSEGLLALPALRQMAGQRVLVLRGQGGRPLLGDGLAARGARLDYAEVYRRVPPRLSQGELLGHCQTIDLIIVTSNEMLDNLCALLDGSACRLLADKTLMVVSDRGRQHALDLGFRRIVCAGGADDDRLIAAMRQWAEDENPGMMD
jgi:uroporphyrinogen-III synthase